MLNENIRALRLERKISQTTLARKLHVTQGAVSQWETGATRPDTEQLLTIADLFGVSVDALLGVDREDNSVDLASASDGLSNEEKEALNRFLWLLKNSGDRSKVDHAIWTIDSLYEQENSKK